MPSHAGIDLRAGLVLYSKVTLEIKGTPRSRMRQCSLEQHMVVDMFKAKDKGEMRQAASVFWHHLKEENKRQYRDRHSFVSLVWPLPCADDYTSDPLYLRDEQVRT